MVETAPVAERVAPLAARIAAREGCTLDACEYVNQAGRWFLRVYIDHEDGVTIDHCSAVSRQLSAVLDVEDLIPHAYCLEVSSPGLDRQLQEIDDFRRFTGQAVKLKTTGAVRGRRRFRGVLGELVGDAITLRTEDGQEFEIPLAKVQIARLDPQI